MKKSLLLSGMVLTLVAAPLIAQTPDIWVCGYYPGWAQSSMPPSAIDYTGLTHVIHFSMLPVSGGRIDPQFLTHSQSVAAVAAAHGANKKILLCFGGASTRDSFAVATQPAVVATLIKNITDSVRVLNYDGVDIDWEEVLASDTAQFGALVRGLRSSLDTMNPPRMLTTAVGGAANLMGRYVQYFDQMNLMTYGMSNAWPGWVTWHASPIYNGGYRFPSTNGLVPSIDGSIDQYSAAGIPLAKLGFGMGFYGDLWQGGSGTPTGGVTAPRQVYTTDPTVQSEVPYRDIVNNYYTAANYHWDTAAAAAYLGIDQAGSSNDKFISYDDEKSAAAKVAYARSKHVGGFIIWHIQHGYFSGLPSGQRSPLLAAISRALQTTRAGTQTLAAAQRLNSSSAKRVCMVGGSPAAVLASGCLFDLQGRSVVGISTGRAVPSSGVYLLRRMGGLLGR
jgi:chitinase